MSRSRIFKTNWHGRGRKWRLIAEALNQIGEVLNNVTINGRDAELTRHGLALTAPEGGRAFNRLFQSGRLVEKDDWSILSSGWGAAAEETDFLAVPFDAAISPYYVLATGAASWATLETTWFPYAIDHETDDNDPRKDAEFFQISMCAGDQRVILS